MKRGEINECGGLHDSTRKPLNSLYQNIAKYAFKFEGVQRYLWKIGNRK